MKERMFVISVLLIWGIAQTLTAINESFRLFGPPQDLIVAREIQVRSADGERKIVLSVNAVDGGIWFYGSDCKTHCMLLPHEAK